MSRPSSVAMSPQSKPRPMPAASAASRVGEIVAVHVIARPHANADEVLPLGRGTKAAKK